MVTLTPRLSLLKPAIAGELVDIAIFNSNMQKIDDYIDAFVCTSATRPSNPFQGMLIWETDKQRLLMRDGVNNRWLFVSGTIDWKPMELNQPTAPLSRIGGIWPGGFSATAVGIGIGPGHRTHVRLGRIKYTGTFTAGNFVQLTKLAGSDALMASCLNSAALSADGPIFPMMAHVSGSTYTWAIGNINADGSISARVGATVTDPNVAVQDLIFDCPVTVGV